VIGRRPAGNPRLHVIRPKRVIGPKKAMPPESDATGAYCFVIGADNRAIFRA
jgi:hypothetical protein